MHTTPRLPAHVAFVTVPRDVGVTRDRLRQLRGRQTPVGDESHRFFQRTGNVLAAAKAQRADLDEHGGLALP